MCIESEREIERERKKVNIVKEVSEPCRVVAESGHLSAWVSDPSSPLGIEEGGEKEREGRKKERGRGNCLGCGGDSKRLNRVPKQRMKTHPTHRVSRTTE